MPMIPFPTPNTKPADLRRAGAVARTLALGVRFRGRPADAARFVLTAAPIETAEALAADDTLALIRTRRALDRAHRAGNLSEVAQLRPRVARLCAALTETARRHGVKGWHLVIVLAVLVVAHGPAPAFASASECAAIRDHDRRESCIAETSGHAADCEAVRNADKRAECRARSE